MLLVERYCLRVVCNGGQSTKKEIVQKTQCTWKSECYAKDKEKISDIKMSRYCQQHHFYMTRNIPNLHQIS